MTAGEILGAIRVAGAALHLVDGEILIETAAPIAPELLVVIRQRKGELLALVPTVGQSATTTEPNGRETPLSVPAPVPMPPDSVEDPCRECGEPMREVPSEGPSERKWTCSKCAWWIICATY